MKKSNQPWRGLSANQHSWSADQPYCSPSVYLLDNIWTRPILLKFPIHFLNQGSNLL